MLEIEFEINSKVLFIVISKCVKSYVENIVKCVKYNTGDCGISTQVGVIIQQVPGEVRKLICGTKSTSVQDNLH